MFLFLHWNPSGQSFLYPMVQYFLFYLLYKQWKFSFSCHTELNTNKLVQNKRRLNGQSDPLKSKRRHRLIDRHCQNKKICAGRHEAKEGLEINAVFGTSLSHYSHPVLAWLMTHYLLMQLPIHYKNKAQYCTYSSNS